MGTCRDRNEEVKRERRRGVCKESGGLFDTASDIRRGNYAKTLDLSCDTVLYFSVSTSG